MRSTDSRPARGNRMTRNAWLVVFSFAALFAAACNSGRRPSVVEELGTTSSALFVDGVPCSAASQCGSNNCVDGVCCDTACGGGVRDLLACSNVYGPVNGLANGTCRALVVGNACGSLTTVNPCTWRGTVVNGGGNCPNPPGGASACFPCAGPGDCSGAFPICLNNACVACDGNFGSAATAACPVTAPTCTAGLCTQCTAADLSACTGTTPTCNTATGACAACNGDNGSGATRACPTSAAGACLPGGTCAACSATNATACVGNTPSCDTATNTCSACNGDFGSASALRCPTAASPYCFTAGNVGSCGKCTTDPDCVGHPGGPKCDTVSGACGAGCVTDVDCAAGTEWCAAGVCATKTANGQPLPATAPVNGVCTVANGTRVCQSGVCDVTDNLCGLKNGATCGPPTTSSRCRSGTCFAADNKCGLPAGQDCVTQNDCRSSVCPPSGKCGNCQNDAACGAVTSGQVCNDLAKTCGAGCRGTGGNGCAAGTTCTSTDATIGQCVQCVVDATCGGLTSGKVCNPTTKACQSGCRGSGGNGCEAGLTCGSLDGTIGKCTECATDVNCGGATSGQVCNDDKLCQAGCRGTGGNACPTGQVCSSTNNTIGTCQTPGADAGTGCSNDADCGNATSGRLCNATTRECFDGCRGQVGNGCPQGQQCSSTSLLPGVCSPVPALVPDAGVDEGILEGGGLACSTALTGSGRGNNVGLLVLGVSLALLTARRRRRAA